MNNRIISYGGGVQSTALVLLAIKGEIPPSDFAVFSNVGDDSEHPKTLAFVRDIMIPYANSHGYTVIETHRMVGKGVEARKQSLMARMLEDPNETGYAPIPVYGDTGKPLRRVCTVDHKITVVERWIKQQYAVLPVEVQIGISTDEYQRARTQKPEHLKVQRKTYPLLDIGWDRNKCLAYIAECGLPLPPKSSCFFCPFHSASTWQELLRNEPDLFERATHLERTLNKRRIKRGMKPVYLTKHKKPLDKAIHPQTEPLFSEEVFNEGGCDEGYCWT